MSDNGPVDMPLVALCNGHSRGIRLIDMDVNA